jgi:hypothetical protein
MDRITINDIRALKDGEGLTLEGGKAITYASGWQVATEGIETRDAARAMKAVQFYGGTCGIWFADGIYYVDKSQRIETKEEALEIGRLHHQISIYGWANAELVYC